MTRIEETDIGLSILIKMSGGNPGALTVLSRILKEGTNIDPYVPTPFLLILTLDTFEIYESRIWMFYKDVCNENIEHTIAMIRALQLGLVSKEIMDHAIDNRGNGLDMPNVLNTVQERLPNFKIS